MAKEKPTTAGIIGAGTSVSISLTSKSIHHHAIQLVEKQLKELGGDFTEKDYKTSGKIDDSKSIDIRTITDPNQLVKLLSGVRLADREATETAAELGISAFKFKRNDSTYEEWKHDVKIRLHILSSESKRKELKQTLQELKDLITDEEKRFALYQKIGLVEEINETPAAETE